MSSARGRFHLPAHLLGQTTEDYCEVCGKETLRQIHALARNAEGKVTACIAGPCMNPHRAHLTKDQQKRRERQRQGDLFA